MNPAERNDTMVRYLLGRLSADERAQLEQQYSADNGLFEELVEVENRMVDSYVRGELAGADRLDFEKLYLTVAERREKVEFARALARESSDVRVMTSQPGWKLSRAWSGRAPLVRRIAWAATVLVLAGTCLWLWNRDLRLNQELAALRGSQARLKKERQHSQQRIASLESQIQTTSPMDLAPAGTPGQSAVMLTLSDDLTRGGGKANILPLPRSIGRAVLLLNTAGGAYSSYDVSLETPEGKTVLRKEAVSIRATPKGKQAIVDLPASILKRGDYILRLIGITPDGRANEVNAYSFRVVTR